MPSADAHGRRKNLEKYYKYVFICRVCKKEFGTDTKGPASLNDRISLCPICSPQPTRLRRLLREELVEKL